MMAFWDLNETDRDALKTALITRQSMLDRNICPPEEIRILNLMKKYSMTTADIEAAMKGKWNG